MAEKVKVVRDGVAAFNRRDIAALIQLGHPNVEFRASGRLPGIRSVTGREGVRAWCEDLFEAFDVELKATPLIETDDAVAATVKMTARGKHSGVSLDNTLVIVWRFRHDLVTALDAYASRTEALDSVGVRE